MPGKVQWVTNAGSLAQKKRLLADQVAGNLRTAAKAHAEKMREAAELLSRGTLSPQDKKRMGYPYSSRLPANSSTLPDYIINQVTGKFAQSWQTRVQQTRQGWTISLLNTSPEAKFMMGTKAMRTRPILIQVEKMMTGEMPASVRKVTRRAVQENGTSGSEFGAVFYAVAVGAASIIDGVESGLSD